MEVSFASRLCRQQEYLEKSVEGLKRKLQASSEAQRADTARFRQVRLQCMSLLSLYPVLVQPELLILHVASSMTH